MNSFKLILIFSLILLSNRIVAQIAFPGAEGYGAHTRGAYSGSSSPRILIVDNLRSDETGDENTGRGSFLWCLNRPYPRIILFEVSGTIDYRILNEPIIIKYPYLTIAGQTAPGSGITLRGTVIHISNQSQNHRNQSHDVIIQHLRIRHGDDPQGTEYNERDCLTMNGDNIIIDHCSFSWSIDVILGMGTCNNVTISNCIISEPLHYSYHFREGDTYRPEKHGFAVLIRKSTHVSIIKNLFAYSFERNPLSRAKSVAIINNMMYNSAGCKMGAIIDGADFVDIDLWYQGNIVLRTQNTTCPNSVYAAQINSDVGSGSRLYFSDNICVKSLQDTTISEWEKIHSNNDSIQPVDTSPLSNQEYMILESSKVEEHIMEHVGAKPDARDAVDLRILESVQNRVGEYINSPYPLPARAYNTDYTETKTHNGNFIDGFDWSDSTKIIVIEGDTIYLNQNCNTIDDIFNLINPQLPDHIDSYQVHGGYYIGFSTIGKGSLQSITVSGNGLIDFGILEGIYYGSDGVGGYPEIEEIYRPLASIDGYPSENPHADHDKNGYSKLEEWIYAIDPGYDSTYYDPGYDSTYYDPGYDSSYEMSSEEKYKIFPNPSTGKIYIQFYRNQILNFPLTMKIYNTSGELIREQTDIYNYNIIIEKVVPGNVYIFYISDKDNKIVCSEKISVVGKPQQ